MKFYITVAILLLLFVYDHYDRKRMLKEYSETLWKRQSATLKQQQAQAEFQKRYKSNNYYDNINF